MYFKPKKKGCKVDFGKGRNPAIPMQNIVEVDERANTACIKAMTGAVMIFFAAGGGKMNMPNKNIAKLIANDNFIMSTSFVFSEIK